MILRKMFLPLSPTSSFRAKRANLCIFISLLFLLLICPIFSQKVSKCCPLGQLLSGGGCVSMTSGTALPKISVGGGLVSFKWLKDQKMLKEGSTPRCVKPVEIYLDFLDALASEEYEPHFSEDGVFVHELKYYRHGAYCVEKKVMMVNTTCLISR
jgi:hypothetical protein